MHNYLSPIKRQNRGYHNILIQESSPSPRFAMGSTFFEFDEPGSSDKKEPVNINVPKFLSFSAMQADA